MATLATQPDVNQMIVTFDDVSVMHQVKVWTSDSFRMRSPFLPLFPKSFTRKSSNQLANKFRI